MIAFYASILSLLSIGFTEPETPNDTFRSGSYCLTVALKSLDVKTSIETVEKNLGEVSPSGYSLNQLMKTAESYQLFTTIAKSTLGDLRWRKKHFKERFVCLTLIRDDHYVLLTDIKSSTVSVCDPPNIKLLDIPVFDRIWTRDVLLISRNPLASEVEVKNSRNRWRFAQYAGYGLFLVLCIASIITIFVSRHRQKRLEMGLCEY